MLKVCEFIYFVSGKTYNGAFLGIFRGDLDFLIPLKNPLRSPIKCFAHEKKPPAESAVLFYTVSSSYRKPVHMATCHTLFDPSWRNWFHISRLVTIIAIGLRNTYAKSDSGAGLVLV
jgi:hypothetical protein